jgi:hypothetical protein
MDVNGGVLRIDGWWGHCSFLRGVGFQTVRCMAGGC